MWMWLFGKIINFGSRKCYKLDGFILQHIYFQSPFTIYLKTCCYKNEMWRSRRSKQKKDIVIIVNVTTCIYSAFSSNWHRKSCVIFRRLCVSARTSLRIFFVTSREAKISAAVFKYILREVEIFYAEIVHQVDFRRRKLSWELIEKWLSCPWGGTWGSER